MQNKILLCLVALILTLGIYARVAELNRHFSHVDDIGVAKSIIATQEEGRLAAFAVSEHWTYAPFQFLVTSLVLNAQQSYRQVLFWGRVPSCVFALLGLICIVLFYRRWKKDWAEEGSIALLILTFSWANIILAKQMHNYALGVSASVFMLWLLMDGIKQPKLTLLRSVVEGVVLGILASTQYSVIFLIPGFFAARFWQGLQNKEKYYSLGINLFACAVFCMLIIFPLWWFFLRRLIAAGYGGVSDWSQGPQGEYVFSLPATNLWEHISYAAVFFVNNFYLIVQSSTAIFSDSSFLKTPFTIVMLIFLMLGIYSFILTKERERRLVSIYAVGVFLTWIALVVLGKLTFSPTRHSLIFLPLLALLIAEGFCFCAKKLFRQRSKLATSVFVLLLIIIFSVQFPQFLKERRDPFSEDDFIELVKTYDVDAVISANWTTQLEVMRKLRDYYGYFGKHFLDYSLIARDPKNYDTVLWVSHRDPLNPQTLMKSYQQVNKFVYFLNALRVNRGELPFAFWQPFEGVYDILYKKEIKSEIESEYSRHTHNGTNSLYIYVLRRR
jgi:hypothetical protein